MRHFENYGKCSKCGKRFTEVEDISSEANPRGPLPGDLSVCMRCGEVHTMSKDMKFVISEVHDFTGVTRDDKIALLELSEKVRMRRRAERN